MRAVHFITCMTLALAATVSAAASAVDLRPAPRVVLQDYSRLYAWIIVDRKLGDPYDDALVRELQSQSRVEHFRDGSANPIVVIKVELFDKAGISLTRSKYGDYPFYVVRETPRGLLLMGRMFGSAYRSTFADGKLEFLVDLHPTAARTVRMRFRAEDGVLVNLTPQGPNRDMFLAGANGASVTPGTQAMLSANVSILEDHRTHSRG